MDEFIFKVFMFMWNGGGIENDEVVELLNI